MKNFFREMKRKFFLSLFSHGGFLQTLNNRMYTYNKGPQT